MYGCKNCRHFRFYPSNDWYQPDEYDCSVEEYADYVYSDGVTWDNNEEPLCPRYEYQEEMEDY